MKPPFPTSGAGWRNTSWLASLAVTNGYLDDRELSLRQGTLVDATLTNAPSLSKNKGGKRNTGMQQTKKGQQYYFDMKAQIGVDDELGLVPQVMGTVANVADVTQVDRVIKRQFGYVKARFSGPVQNTAQLVALFARSDLWMARRHLLTHAGRLACNE